MKITNIRLTGPDFLIPATEEQKASDEDNWVMRIDVMFNDKQVHVAMKCSKDGEIAQDLFSKGLKALSSYFEQDLSR